jgi:hypothetical protein
VKSADSSPRRASARHTASLPTGGRLMNLVCERAQMCERAVYDRTKAVFEYCNLVYEAEPPLKPARGHLCH